MTTYTHDAIKENAKGNTGIILCKDNSGNYEAHITEWDDFISTAKQYIHNSNLTLLRAYFGIDSKLANLIGHDIVRINIASLTKKQPEGVFT